MPNPRKQLEKLQLERSLLEGELLEAKRRAEAADLHYRTSLQKRATGTAKLDAEIATLQKQIIAEQADLDSAELLKIGEQMDRDGANPAATARFEFLIKSLRGKRLHTSHESVQLSLRRLACEAGTTPLPFELRSYSALARLWVKPAQQEIAA
jgi:hypothetical protein